MGLKTKRRMDSKITINIFVDVKCFKEVSFENGNRSTNDFCDSKIKSVIIFTEIPNNGLVSWFQEYNL